MPPTHRLRGWALGPLLALTLCGAAALAPSPAAVPLAGPDLDSASSVQASRVAPRPPAPWQDTLDHVDHRHRALRQQTIESRFVRLRAPSQVYVGQRFQITGKVTGLHGKRPGAIYRWYGIQERVNDRWNLVTLANRRADRTFIFRLDDWGTPGVRRMRLRLPRNNGPALIGPVVKIKVVERAPEVVKPGPPGGAPGDYSLLSSSTNADGSPIRWNPCQPIRWSFNAGGTEAAYPNAHADISEAMRRVSAHTGLQFTYAGPTTFVPFTGSYPHEGFPEETTDLVIAFATEAQAPLLADNVLGLGGQMGYIQEQDGSLWVDRGGVTLDIDALDMDKGYRDAGAVTWGQVMVHEVLHAVGLGHAQGAEQVMYPMLHTENHNFGAGDITGMNVLGAQHGCPAAPAPSDPAAG